MSLQSIRTLRRAGQKPGVTFVVIGERPNLDDDWQTIFVTPTDDPRSMDWRPVVGVLVAVFTLKPDPDRTIAVLEELQTAGATLFGAADQSGVYPLLADSDQSHETCLRKGWELLCRC